MSDDEKTKKIDISSTAVEKAINGVSDIDFPLPAG
jgi:hypothetical protein